MGTLLVLMAETTVTLDVPGNDLMSGLVGERDHLLRRVEAAFPDAAIHVRGNQISVDGPGADLVGRVFGELVLLLERGLPLDDRTLDRAIDMVRADESPAEVLGTEIMRTARGKPVRPRSAGQKRYVEAVRDGVVTFAIGPAGTGKSWLAVAMAVRALQAGQVDRIVLTRPLVEAGERVGFLPGDLMAKVDPYLRPLYDALFEMLDVDAAQRLLDRGQVEVAPLAFMRGRTLNNSFVILDEAQNTSPEQMKMFLTRIGFGTRVVITGDASQVDVPEDCVGYITGKGGAVLRSLEEEWGTLMFFARSKADQGSDEASGLQFQQRRPIGRSSGGKSKKQAAGGASREPSPAKPFLSFVKVGDPGNKPDKNFYGRGVFGDVDSAYEISTRRVTNEQYAVFLNAVAASDPAGLFNPDMQKRPEGGILRLGSPGEYTYRVRTEQASKTVNFVSWYDALRFCNWLHNGRPTGEQSARTTESGAYTFSAKESVGEREKEARFALSSENEWYKAAYFSPQRGYSNMNLLGRAVVRPEDSKTHYGTEQMADKFFGNFQKVVEGGDKDEAGPEDMLEAPAEEKRGWLKKLIG